MSERRRSTDPLFPDQQVPPAPAGHVWVEWVGEASPLDEPWVGFALLTGRYSAEQQYVIRELMRRRIARVDGHSRTLCAHNGPGGIPALSRDVTWGNKERARPGQPGSFIQALSFRDADAVKGSVVGHEFRICRERDGDDRVGRLLLPTRQIEVVPAGKFANAGDFRRAMGW